MLYCLTCVHVVLYQLSATNSVHAELIDDDGEARYKITTIIGTKLQPNNIEYLNTNLRALEKKHKYIFIILGF